MTKCSDESPRFEAWQQEFTAWIEAPYNYNGQLIQSDDNGLPEIWQPQRSRLKILASGGLTALDPGHSSDDSLFSVINRELRALGLPSRLELHYSTSEIFAKADNSYDANIAYLTEDELLRPLIPSLNKHEMPFWQLPGYRRLIDRLFDNEVLSPSSHTDPEPSLSERIHTLLDEQLSAGQNAWLFIIPSSQQHSASQRDEFLFDHPRIIPLLLTPNRDTSACILDAASQANISLQVTKAIGVSLARRLGH